MRALPLIAALVFAGFFGWIAALPWLGAAPPAPPPAPTPAPETAPGTGQAPESAPGDAPRTDLSPFAERPLFSAVRRPPPPASPGLPVAPARPDLLFERYEVAGVVMLGDAAIALLRDADGRLIRLRAGETIATGPVGDGAGSADIVEITLDSLTFRHDGATVTTPVRRGGAKTE